MKFEVSFSQMLSGDEELKRNFQMLLATAAGSQPVERDFGISRKCLDAVGEIAESMLLMELEEKTERYFPELRITQTEISRSTENGMEIRIWCSRKET